MEENINKSPIHQQHGKLFGTLFDVSGSMEDKYPSKRKDEIEINKFQSVFDQIVQIVDTEQYPANNYFFSIAFGLQKQSTCDIISLLEYFRNKLKQKLKPQFPKSIETYENCKKLLEKYGIKENLENFIKKRNQGFCIMGHKPLIELVSRNGAPGAEKYIREYFDTDEAGDYFIGFSKNELQLKKYIEKLPSSCKENSIASRLKRFGGGSFRDIKGMIEKEKTKASYLFDNEDNEIYQTLEKLLDNYDLSSNYISKGDEGFFINSHEPLIKLLSMNGAPGVHKYIKKYLDQKEAGYFF